MTNEEMWKPISDFGRKYEISSEGRLRRSGTLRVLTATRSGAGYLKADLWHENKRTQIGVHRLVAKAFLSEPGTELKEVNHINGDKKDNAASNLEWVTRRGNVDHFQYRLGKTVRPVLAIAGDGTEKYYASVSAAQRDGYAGVSVWRALNDASAQYRGQVWVDTPFRPVLDLKS